MAKFSLLMLGGLRQGLYGIIQFEVFHFKKKYQCSHWDKGDID